MKELAGYVCLGLATLLAFALGVIFIEWLDERHALCLDQVITLGESRETQCKYPEQRVALERGITHTLAVCRCKP